MAELLLLWHGYKGAIVGKGTEEWLGSPNSNPSQCTVSLRNGFSPIDQPYRLVSRVDRPGTVYNRNTPKSDRERESGSFPEGAIFKVRLVVGSFFEFSVFASILCRDP